jgi:SWI/SNF-related matrix-associated actin-dependent regulator 1 of chromatin subfamily A
MNFKVAILDEAHYLKNSDAKRTEKIMPLIKRCKRPILLTGTPAFAKPKELFNLLHIIRPDIFLKFREYGNRYCDPKLNRWSGGLDFDGATNIKELHYILLNSIMIRRLKKDVLKELPAKRRQKIEVKVD